jgi:Short C-terminal domain
MLRRPAVGRGRPGLLGTMARTAVVAGTATATANAVGHRQSRRYQQQAEEEAAPQAAQAQDQPADPTPPGSDMMSQLKQLADMKSAGMLSDQEFTAAKAKLLGP